MIEVRTSRGMNRGFSTMGTKVSARWVQRFLTPDEKRARFIIIRENIFEGGTADFVYRFVTMDSPLSTRDKTTVKYSGKN